MWSSVEDETYVYDMHMHGALHLYGNSSKGSIL